MTYRKQLWNKYGNFLKHSLIKVAVASTLLLTLSCQTLDKSLLKFKDVSLFSSVYEDVTLIDNPEALNDARFYLKEKKPRRVLEEIAKYFRFKKDIYWEGLAYLYRGEAYVLNQDYSKAVASYRNAIQYGAGYHNSVLVTAMYSLSFLYERTQNYEKLVPLLMDLMRRLTDKDYYVREVETPARLANVYFLLNKWTPMQKYRKQAKANMASLGQNQLSLLGKRYYRTKEYLSMIGIRIKSPIIPLEKKWYLAIQNDLLDIGEEGSLEQSQRSFAHLDEFYSNWEDQLVKTEELSVTDVEKIRRNQKRIDQMADFMDAAVSLNASRRPLELVSRENQTRQFFVRMDNRIDRIKAVAEKIDIGLLPSNKGINKKEKEAIKTKHLILKTPQMIKRELILKGKK